MHLLIFDFFHFSPLKYIFGFLCFFLEKTYKPKNAYITHKIEVLDEEKIGESKVLKK